MATYTKPVGPFNWATDNPGVDRVEPGAGKRGQGWLNLELPPEGFFNMIQGKSGDFLDWLNERFADGTTNDELDILDPATGVDVAIRVRGQDVVVGDDLFVGEFSGTEFNAVHFGSAPDNGGNQISFRQSAEDFSFFMQGSRVVTLRTDLTSTRLTLGGDHGAVGAGYIIWNSGANEFRIGSGGGQGQLRFDPDAGVFGDGALFPETHKDIEVGTIANAFSDVVSDRGIFIQNNGVAQDNVDVCSRHANNAVVAKAVLGTNGAADMTVNARHWNVVSAVRVGVGIYNITLDSGVDQGSTCIILANEFQLQNNMGGQFLDSTTVQITTRNSGGVLIDFNGTDVYFTLIGGPEIIPG